MTELFKFSEENEVNENIAQESWNILIVDDDEDVHTATKIALKHFRYKNRGLILHHAYSGYESIEFIKKNRNIAIVFLDVIMETDHAGLDAIHPIRKHNPNTRIIIRTGQPGTVPEAEVIVNYEIDSYKEKSELTAQKLFSTVVSSLRTYDTLTHLDETYTKIETEVITNEERINSYNKGMDTLKTILSRIPYTVTIDEHMDHILGVLEDSSQVLFTQVVWGGNTYGSATYEESDPRFEPGINTIYIDGNKHKMVTTMLESRNRDTIGRFTVCFTLGNFLCTEILIRITVLIGYILSGLIQKTTLEEHLYKKNRIDPFSGLPILFDGNKIELDLNCIMDDSSSSDSKELEKTTIDTLMKKYKILGKSGIRTYRVEFKSVDK